MPKYFSGRKKRTPQSGLTSDRYQYLSIEQAEPNLGDPPEVDNIPTGTQYQIVSVANHPGERYWRTLTGGIQPGAITVREDDVILPNAEGISSITDINFKGNILTAEGYLQPDGTPGTGVTITAAPIGNDHDIIFNNNGEFGAATGGLTYDNDNTRVGIASTQPDQTLDIDGSLFISGNVFDKTKTNSGSENQVLVRSATGGLIWADQSIDGVSDAGGDPTQVQFHAANGKIDGGTLLVYDYTHGSTDERVGIGSTQPTRLLDVLGNSRFVGVTTFVGDVYVEGKVTTEDVTNIDSIGIVTARKGIRISDDGLIVVGVTTLENTRILHDKALYFGKDGDNNLEIKFDGTDSVINDISPANLGFKLQQSGNTKLEVTQSGIIVTGVTTTDILSVTGLVTSHLIPSPSTVGLFDLGSDSNRWDNIYANNINVGTYSPVSLTVEQLKATGISTISNLEVTGMSTFIGLSTFSDGLEVISGVTTFAGITTVTGETLFTEQFSVAGVSTIADASAKSLYVSGLSTFVGFSTFKDDVFVAGVSTFIGFTTFRDDIHVTGLSTFVGFSTFADIIVGGMSTFVGISSFEGNVSFNAGIRDKDGELGGPTNGYILESRDGKVNWANPQGLTVENSNKVGIGSTDKDSIYYPAFVKNNNEHDDRQNEYLYNTHDFIYSYDGNAGIGSVGIGTDIIADSTTLNVTGITSFKGDVYFNGTDENNLGVTSLTWKRSTGVLEFKDNVKAIFGDGTNGDLQIYHNPAADGVSEQSWIRDTGDGDLNLTTDGESIKLMSGGNWATGKMAAFNKDASVDLYYNNDLKFQTSGYGVTVTGITTTDTLAVAGIASFWGPVWDKTGSPGGDTYLLESTIDGVNWKSPENITVQNALQVGVGTTGAVSVGATSIYYLTFVDSNNTEGRYMEYLYSGSALTYNVHYVDGVGIGSIGIGTTTPNSTLDVLGITSFRGNVYFNGIDDNDGSVGITSITWKPSSSALEFKDNVKSTFGDDGDLEIYYDGATDGQPSGGHSIIKSGEKSLSIISANTVEIEDENRNSLAEFHADGNAELYWNGSSGVGKKFETTEVGVKVSGLTTTTELRLDGAFYDKDNSYGAQSGYILETRQSGGVAWVSPSDLTTINANKIGIGSINAADPGIGTHFITFVDENHPHGDRKNEEMYSTGLFVYDPQDNGRVGIGTTIPSDTLSVSGITSFKGDVYFNSLNNEHKVGVTSLTWRESVGILEFKTNVKAIFGDDDEDSLPGLEIYQDGTNAIIHNNGEGNLNLKTYGGSSVQLLGNNTELMVDARSNSSVDLYYDGGTPKLQTSGIGITVTGLTSTTQLMVKGIFYDGLNEPGDVNEVLTSQGGSVKWTDPAGLSADTARRLNTVGVNTDHTYHLTFVEDHNTTPGQPESVYTGAGITFNASNSHLSLNGSLWLKGEDGPSGDIISYGGDDGIFGIFGRGSKFMGISVVDTNGTVGDVGIVSFISDNGARKTYFNSNVNPKTTENYNLAESNSHRWANVYAKDYHGEFFNIYDSDSTNKITLQAPATGNLTADYTLTLPVDDGEADEVLKTDGSGNLSWTTNTPGTPTLDKIEEGDTSAEVVDNGTDGHFKVLTEGTERLRIDKDGNLLLRSGTSSSQFKTGSYESALQVEGTSLESSSVAITRNSDDPHAPSLVFGKSRGTTVGSNGTTLGDDKIGRINFYGSDNTGDYNLFAGIVVQVDKGNGVAVGADESPGRLAFFTTPDNSNTSIERLRITKDGAIGIDAQGSGRNATQIYGDSGQVLKSGGAGASVYWGDAGSGSGSLSSVQVKQYEDDLGTGPGKSTPRTERTCEALNAPITVSTVGDTSVIGIGSTSNAYGNRYIGDTEPSVTPCEGDIWYDTSESDGSSSNNSVGVTRVALLEYRLGSGYGDLGTITANTWTSRALTDKVDPQDFVIFPVATDTADTKTGFSLGSGTYRIKWSVPAGRMDRHQTSLRYSTNYTLLDSTDPNDYERVLGSSECVENSANTVQSRSFGETILTLTQRTYFKMYSIIDGVPVGSMTPTRGFNTAGIFGDGRTITGGAAPDKSVYTQISIEDLATAVKNTGDAYVPGITKIARLYDAKTSSNTAGAPPTGDTSYIDRILNTKDDPNGFVNFGSTNTGTNGTNVSFSLEAGDYKINWRASSHDAKNLRSKLVYANNSSFNSSSEVLGETGVSDETDPESNYYNCGAAIIKTTETTWFKIQQAQSKGNWGQACGVGGDEIYTQLVVEDLKTAIKDATAGGKFTDLTDTPSDYTESANKVVSVKPDSSGLEFTDRGATVTTSDTPPSNPSSGDLWWNSTNGILNVHYTDADGSQWVNATGRGSNPSGANVPVGGIIMYSGTKTDLDAMENWKLCDGTVYGSVTTPNLKDKFVIGADQYSSDKWKTNIEGTLKQSGGSKDAIVVEHNHDITEPNSGQGHLHNVAYSNSDSGDGVIEESGTGFSGYEPSEYATTGITINDRGDSGTNANLPPYFALAYIMRVS